jgi:hypothetical protein
MENKPKATMLERYGDDMPPARSYESIIGKGAPGDIEMWVVSQEEAERWNHFFYDIREFVTDWVSFGVVTADNWEEHEGMCLYRFGMEKCPSQDWAAVFWSFPTDMPRKQMYRWYRRGITYGQEEALR